jgi:hypothetical protein
MSKNIWSLGLLRNGKVYGNKELAIQGLTQVATNDGVAKLARYLEPVDGGDPIIRTLVGFYADANEMEDAGGGQSSYTVLDIDGSAADINQIKEDIAEINGIIGNGIQGKTLTEAINEINAKIGEGFSAEHTVADALVELKGELEGKLKVTLDVAGTPTEGYLKTYELKQGGELVGKIDIPKDLVVKEGKLVHGYWSGDTFTEDEEGPDTAIKLVIANQEAPIYINTKDLVDYYTAGDGISIDNDHNVISIKYNTHSEEFLIVDEDGIRVEGIQAAIDLKAEQERLSASDGISIASNKVKAISAKFSAPGIENPISVDASGIKLSKSLDCGFYDDETVIANDAADITAIADPNNTDVFISGDEALDALATKKTFKNLEVANVEAAQQVNLAAVESIALDDVEVTGDKGSSNGYFLVDAPQVEVSNITIADGAKPYNVFEEVGAGTDSFNASNVNVDDVALKHNVFNIYRPNNDAVINISDVNLNLDVNNSNALRLANYKNATGVTVNFENVFWTYENTPNKDAADWGWAGLIIYQPASSDVALGGDLSKVKTWTFNFKNCKYNGVKVTENNFGEKNQVFYLYNVGGDESMKDPVANGLNLNFE